MSEIVETVAAPVDATKSGDEVNDLNIDDISKTSKLAALKGDCDDASGVEGDTHPQLESINNSHSNGSTNGDDAKSGQNGSAVPDHTSPDKDATAEHPNEVTSESAMETGKVQSSEAQVSDRSEEDEKSPDDTKANDTDSTKVSLQEDATVVAEAVAEWAALVKYLLVKYLVCIFLFILYCFVFVYVRIINYLYTVIKMLNFKTAYDVFKSIKLFFINVHYLISYLKFLSKNSKSSI